MINALLLAATYVNCSFFQGVEIEDSIYTYGFSSKKTISLETKENKYSCSFDMPFVLAPGIKTVERYRCGPITVFTQTLFQTCTRSDYNPSPDDFYRSLDYGKKLLSIQHDCIEDGIKMTGGWTKLRDRNGEEWELKQTFRESGSSSECSSKERKDTFTKTYEIEKTGDIVKIVEETSYPVESVKKKRKPLL